MKFGNYWYNVDTTRDDPIGGSPNFKFFLKLDGDFENHIRADKYKTESLYRQYPMAAPSTQCSGKPKILLWKSVWKFQGKLERDISEWLG